MSLVHLKLLVFNSLVALLSLVFIPFKWLLSRSGRYIDKELDSMLPGSQAALAVLTPSRGYVTLIAAITLNGQLTPERVRELFQERLLQFPNKIEEIPFKRLRFTWKFLWGYPFWRRTDFKVENHIRAYDYRGENLALPHPCCEKDLERVLGELADVPWDAERSPWEILLVNDYQRTAEVAKVDEYQTLFLLRTDHLLMDGFSVLNFLEKLFNVKMVTPQPRHWIKPSKLSQLLYTVKSVWSFARICAEVVPAPTFGQGVSGPGRAACSLSSGTPLSVIRGIGSHFGVSFTAVVVTAIMGAIQRMQEEEAAEVPQYLTTSLVFYKPDRPPGLSNHFYFTAVPWPLKASSSLERLESIEKLVQDKIKSLDCLGLEVMYEDVFQRFPSNIRDILMEISIPEFVNSELGNFPTIKEPVLLDGHEALDMAGCTSFVGCKGGIGVGLSGCNGSQRIAFIYDSGLFPKGEHRTTLGELFDDEVDLLWRRTLE